MVATKKSSRSSALTSLSAFIFLIFSAVLVSCSKSETSAPSKELRIYTWSNYLEDSLIKAFEKATGSNVKLDYFSSNEELLAKIQASVQSGASGYDLIMPSDYMVYTMTKLNLLQELDGSKLAFRSDLAAQFSNPSYDPGLKYSVPVAWGTTGVAVETAKAKGIDLAQGLSWKDLFENPANAGQVTFLDDMKEVFHAALMVLGKKWESAGEAEIAQAFEYIKKNKKNIKAFTTETKPVMEAGECHLCQAYSGDVLRAQQKRSTLKYFIPKEGATLWTDNFSIPKNAPNVALAHEFMAHFLSAESAKAFTELTFFASPNEKSRALLSPALQSNETIFPSAQDRSRLHLIQEKPELMTLMDRYWTELRSE
jgi:spermidine/putrescine transport system substrate-binding protein